MCRAWVWRGLLSWCKTVDEEDVYVRITKGELDACDDRDRRGKEQGLEQYMPMSINVKRLAYNQLLYSLIYDHLQK